MSKQLKENGIQRAMREIQESNAALNRLQDERAADFAKWFKIIGYSGLTEYQAECPQVIDEALRELALYRWMGDMNLYLLENSAIGREQWAVFDVDGDMIEMGETRKLAMEAAKKAVEGPDT